MSHPQRKSDSRHLEWEQRTEARQQDRKVEEVRSSIAVLQIELEELKEKNKNCGVDKEGGKSRVQKEESVRVKKELKAVRAKCAETEAAIAEQKNLLEKARAERARIEKENDVVKARIAEVEDLEKKVEESKKLVSESQARVKELEKRRDEGAMKDGRSLADVQQEILDLEQAVKTAQILVEQTQAAEKLANEGNPDRTPVPGSRAAVLADLAKARKQLDEVNARIAEEKEKSAAAQCKLDEVKAQLAKEQELKDNASSASSAGGSMSVSQVGGGGGSQSFVVVKLMASVKELEDTIASLREENLNLLLQVGGS